jgi:putative membrane protein
LKPIAPFGQERRAAIERFGMSEHQRRKLMKRRVIALLTATCVLAGCHHQETTTADTNSAVVADNGTALDNSAAPAMADTTAKAAGGQLFANTAASSDAFEIESSHFATAKGGSSAVKKFATQMIAAHTESTGLAPKVAAHLNMAKALKP